MASLVGRGAKSAARMTAGVEGCWQRESGPPSLTLAVPLSVASVSLPSLPRLNPSRSALCPSFLSVLSNDPVLGSEETPGKKDGGEGKRRCR